MYSTGIKEIVLLPESDCFTVKTRTHSHLDIPLHRHSEYELNLMENGAGARRIIGHHLEETTGKELVLIGSGLNHSWQPYLCRSKKITETILHFHANLFSEEFLQRHQLKNIKILLSAAARGISFSPKTIAEITPLLHDLRTKSGFESILLLMQILNILSITPPSAILPFEMKQETSCLHEDRIEKVLDYVRKHFSDPITLSQAAGVANMTEGSFSRFFKQRTGRTFVDCVNEIRIDYASRMLADSNNNIATIAFSAGFNNISNFNRIFKSKKNLTPTQYRKVFAASDFLKMCS
jgi:AraC-like DNA-binding protein